MKIEPKNQCPINNFEPCRQLDCAWFLKVSGKDPNTGEDVDDWACSVAWTPVLLIENANMSRQTGAAVESFRNEMVRSNTENQKILAYAAEHTAKIGVKK